MELNGQTLHIETGRIAKQASGSVVVTLGETIVFVVMRAILAVIILGHGCSACLNRAVCHNAIWAMA